MVRDDAVRAANAAGEFVFELLDVLDGQEPDFAGAVDRLLADADEMTDEAYFEWWVDHPQPWHDAASPRMVEWYCEGFARLQQMPGYYEQVGDFRSDIPPIHDDDGNVVGHVFWDHPHPQAQHTARDNILRRSIAAWSEFEAFDRRRSVDRYGTNPPVRRVAGHRATHVVIDDPVRLPERLIVSQDQMDAFREMIRQRYGPLQPWQEDLLDMAIETNDRIIITPPRHERYQLHGLGRWLEDQEAEDDEVLRDASSGQEGPDDEPE